MSWGPAKIGSLVVTRGSHFFWTARVSLVERQIYMDVAARMASPLASLLAQQAIFNKTDRPYKLCIKNRREPVKFGLSSMKHLCDCNIVGQSYLHDWYFKHKKVCREAMQRWCLFPHNGKEVWNAWILQYKDCTDTTIRFNRGGVWLDFLHCRKVGTHSNLVQIGSRLTEPYFWKPHGSNVSF